MKKDKKAVNLGADFKSFWGKASGRSENEQVALWNEIVESPNREYYASLVWKGLEDRKLKILSTAFQNYSKNFDKIQSAFDNFEKTIERQTEKFCEAFSECNLDARIIALAAPTFNGKTGHLISQPSQQVLAFGIDSMIINNDDFNILFSHEFFHIYHGHVSGIRDDGDAVGSPMTMPLWSEGLATFASYEMNPDARKQEILMSEPLASLNEKQFSDLAREFLKISAELTSNRKAYRAWFMGNHTLSDKYPPRSGYALGFKVVSSLRSAYPLKAMAAWSPDIANQKVISMLRKLSND